MSTEGGLCLASFHSSAHSILVINRTPATAVHLKMEEPGIQ